MEKEMLYIQYVFFIYSIFFVNIACTTAIHASFVHVYVHLHVHM